MPSNPSVLALFAPQASVEPTTPKPDYGSDSDFNDYLRDLYGEKWKIPIKKYNWIKHSPSTILFQSK